MEPGEPTQKNQEKHSTAFTSVGIGLGLTLLILVVALSTGSLALLTEAAHSGLDTISAIATLLAVRISARPADPSHHYGHGKYENLSALIEVTLLLIACAWISYEAVQRLFFHPTKVNAPIWAFLVMLISIGVDYARLRQLNEAARQFNSQALEATALNYRSDMLGAGVTIFGLLMVRISQSVSSLGFLAQADSVASILLAGLIVYFGLHLGRRAVEGLLDRTPDISIEEIEKAIQAIPGIIDCHDIRVRGSGSDLFVDVHVRMDGDKTLREVHALMDQIEAEVYERLPDTDVTIHPEPEEERHPPAIVDPPD